MGSIIGFFGAAFGSVGGVGGGGIYVPMLTLIVGFDPKSSTAISKCMMPSNNYNNAVFLLTKIISNDHTNFLVHSFLKKVRSTLVDFFPLEK